MNDPYNAGERLHVRRAAKAGAIAESLDRAVIRELMSTPSGRGWVWRKLESYNVFGRVFDINPYATAFNEGKRNAGLELLAEVMLACPDSYLLAMRESDERSRAHDTDRANATRRANGSADTAEPAGDAAVERDED